MHDEYGALLRHVYEFCWRVAAGSGKSADLILHREQRCGSEFIFFGSTNFFRIRILILIFGHDIFQNGASALIAFMCVLESVCQRKKVFQLENVSFFSLSSAWSAIFHIFFYLFYNYVWIRIQIRTLLIRIQPKYSDSLGFGSTTLSVSPLFKKRRDGRF
jgi:uncharacterized protein with PQ loop repeat